MSLAIKVREAELLSCQSGVKEEEINTVKQQIAAIEKEIAFLEETISSQNAIIAPFNCRLERSYSSDTLLVLSNMDAAVALIPVSLDKAIHVDRGDKVSFRGINQAQLLTGKIDMKQQTMHFIGGKQCIVASAKITELPTDFISGVITQAKIDCGDLSLKNYILQKIIK